MGNRGVGESVLPDDMSSAEDSSGSGVVPLNLFPSSSMSPPDDPSPEPWNHQEESCDSDVVTEAVQRDALQRNRMDALYCFRYLLLFNAALLSFAHGEDKGGGCDVYV